ncbi:DNA gyrase subunit A [Candidatus Woesearchaeota archaeon]|nr:DNA gyrase subunit A [Candidatus Woesearchaeota archaeon]
MNTENKDTQNPEPDNKIIPTVIEDEMKKSFLEYSMSVIVSRALPDIRDGLKPVHRRILFSMNEMGLQYNKSFKKCARIVGDAMGKYHPHGDSAVYDSLVRMAQPWSLRYPLVQGQGNFGSIDGDSAAAMRYTEARLAKISDTLLEDIDKDTVNFQDNFDGSLQEPVILPTVLPNLLVNGSSGIAVGMATNIPPHNLTDVCDAVIETIDNPEISIKELAGIIKGPDFPTGGLLCGRKGVMRAYTKGRGKLRIRAKAETEEKKGKTILVVKEIPYMVNKSSLLEKIADLVKNKIVEGISGLRDESDREGMRIVIELKRDANPDIVLNQLYKHSRLETTQGIRFLALEGNEPKLFNLREMIEHHIRHRIEIITKRTEYELNKAEERAHILEGLIIALENIDDIIQMIRSSDDVSQAREALIENYDLTEMQARAILDMRLQKLASLEQEKIKSEYDELQELIEKLKFILANKDEILKIIKKELIELKEKFGDQRKTDIVEYEGDLEIEDLIEEEDMVVTISHTGYIKRLPLTTYKKQNRGGKGIIGAETKDEDFIEHIFIASTHSYLLVFTDKGKIYWLKVFKIPESGRYSKGKAIINLIEGIGKEENISTVIPIREFDDKHNLLFATKKGLVKKTKLKAYSRPRRGGIWAINLEDDDDLIGVVLTDGTKQIILASRFGQAVKFNEIDARPIGRYSKGVIGMRLRKKDEVVGMVIANDDKTLLTVTENGYGKRTEISDYRLINRGGLGVINIKTTKRNGNVVAIKSVTDEDEVILISKEGKIIRTACKLISIIGRNTQGVRLMKLNPGDKCIDVAKIAPGE